MLASCSFMAAMNCSKLLSKILAFSENVKCGSEIKQIVLAYLLQLVMYYKSFLLQAVAVVVNIRDY